MTVGPRPSCFRPITARSVRGFTLVELLVTIGVIGLLIAILLPALGGAMSSARRFRCQMSQRSVAFDFSVFADETLHGDRGNDRYIGAGRFTIETFQESEYGVDEFWRWNGVTTVTTPDDSGWDPLRCPEVTEPMVLRSNSPCSGGAISPPSSVSYAFNLRLHRREVEVFPGAWGLRPVELDERVLDYSDVPLLIDADGAEATRLGVTPIYTAPAAGSSGPLAGDAFWFPSSRHHGSTNIAFIDGHVVATKTPADIPGWAVDPGLRRP
ncbi:MAG TPA: prepilin-type N-terminal cleavage/methylation domain-containing protein [Phycisphaerales bacterium]|nr:prepilin-type N-terminal cleavage/methylation domain-containing protein [Phycisphaerales bacterium]